MRSRSRTFPLYRVVLLALCQFAVTQGAAVQAQLSVVSQRPFVVGMVPVVGFGAVGGVYIDADGLLREASALPADERLKLLRLQAFAEASAPDLAAHSALRKVSLRRLEERVQRLHAAGKPFPAEVRYLAGLQQVRYIFLYPEARDVVIAGPAEGWTQAPTGEVVGAGSGRPVLHLDDLIVALRYAFAQGRVDPFIGVSIEPTEQGIKKHRAYVSRLRGRFEPSRAKQVFAGMAEAMGPQQIKLYGVEPSSRFAMKLVAADYRLKRLALDHDPEPVPELTSYFDLAARRGRLAAREPQHRWWFLAEYDAIGHSPDGLAFELTGQAVKVVTERTYLAGRGGETEKLPASAAAEQFAESFTEHFTAIAEKMPVFAELQNLIALSVAAELIARGGNRSRGAASAIWRPAHFLDTEKCVIPRVHVPEHVPSLVNYRRVGGRYWLISVSGGVEIDPARLAAAESLAETPSANLNVRRKERPGPDATGWWWD